MKTRKEILNLVRVILHEEKYLYLSYIDGTSKLKYRDYLRERHYLAMKLDSLLWVLGYRGCYYRDMTIKEVFKLARNVIDFNDEEVEAVLEELPFN